MIDRPSRLDAGSLAAISGSALVAVACALFGGCNEADWTPVTKTTSADAAPPAQVAKTPDVAQDVAPESSSATVPDSKTNPSASSADTTAIAETNPGATAESSPTPPPSAAAEPLPMVDITYDTLKFDIEKGAPFERSMLTKPIEALDGRTVKIRGYILPSFLQNGLTQFVLVRDNMECCFGPGAAIYDCVVVEMKPGRSTDFSVRPVAVTGTFSIREMLDADGNPAAIYHLDGDAVE